LPFKTVPKILTFFRVLTYSIVGNGLSTLFGTDKWVHEQFIQEITPTLFVVMHRRFIQHDTVATALLNSAWVQQITEVLSVPTIAEYLRVWEAVRDTGLIDTNDKLVWCRTTDDVYSTSSVYMTLH
jgi:hypothetical protein